MKVLYADILSIPRISEIMNFFFCHLTGYILVLI